MKSKDYSFTSKLMTSLLVFMFFAPTVFATDGYFGVGYDTKSKGMGGAGVALYENSFFGISNPAAMVMHGDKYGIAVGAFMPNRSYTITGGPSAPPAFGLMPGEVESDSKFFPMPSLVANWMLNDNSAFGISLYGNGGMNTNYPTASFHGTSATAGVNLMQMFGAFTYSLKLGDNWSAGISAVVAWQSFEAKGLQAFSAMSQDAAHLTDNGANTSFGFGGKFGIQGEVATGLHFGATFQTPMFMGEFDDYSGLFAENGDFDIPANWTAGIAYELVPDVFTVAFDVKQIFYSNVKSIANPMNMAAALGMDAGSGFGWQDMTLFKFGFEYAANEEWTFRTGFSNGKSPVLSSDVLFNILAPGVIENHITFGFTKMMGDSELNVAIVHALSNDVSGINVMDPAQTINLNMSQWEFEIGITF